jgi:hypothetical protein
VEQDSWLRDESFRIREHFPTATTITEIRIFGNGWNYEGWADNVSIRSTGDSVDDGLIAYYPFNGNADDASGNGIDGTVNGATLTSDREGNPDSAYRFDGDQDYIQTGSSPSLQVRTTMSIAAWIKVEDFDGVSSRAIAAQGTIFDTDGNWQFFVTKNGALRFGKNNTDFSVTSDAAISTSTWHHIAVTFSSGAVKFYVDGEIASTVEMGSSSFNETSDGIKIGEREYSQASNDFKGKIDQFRLYGRVLSMSDVQQLYGNDSNEGSVTLSNGYKYFVTDSRYDPDTDNIMASVIQEYGGGATLADWTALKDLFSNDRADLVSFLDGIGMTERGDGAWVKRDGTRFWSGDRHYFMKRHNGDVGGSFLAHDDMYSNTVSLGSWYSSKPALVRLASNSTTASASAEVDTDEVVSFGETGIDIDFKGTQGSGRVLVDRFGTAPSDIDGISETNVSSYRHVIDVTGDLRFGSDTEVQFEVETLRGIADPNDLRIYRRATSGQGTFTPLPTTYNSDSDELIATTDSFSEFVLASDSNPLPVELAKFDVRMSSDDVLLRWRTASETNNAGFQVQRKTEAGAFRGIGFVKGRGTTTEPQTYQFEDTGLPYAADSLVYRLKQVDTDGASSFSEPVTVSRRAPEEVQLLGTFPNPTHSQATVRYALPQREEVTIRVYDLLGRQVATVKRGPVDPGRKQHQLDTSDLTSGTYFLRLTAGETTRTRKLTVVK